MIPVERYPIRSVGKDVLTSCGSLACRTTTDEDAALIAAELNAALSLRAVNAELLAALRVFVAACDTGSPMQFIGRISDACDTARAAIARAEGAT